MNTPFDRAKGLVIVYGVLDGPKERVIVRFALDTGATTTLVNAAHLIAAGYDPIASTERVRITTGSGIEYAPKLSVLFLTALGRLQSDFALICHTMPPTTTVDGLLGLDFFRGQKLTVDFRLGEIILE